MAAGRPRRPRAKVLPQSNTMNRYVGSKTELTQVKEGDGAPTAAPAQTTAAAAAVEGDAPTAPSAAAQAKEADTKQPCLKKQRLDVSSAVQAEIPCGASHAATPGNASQADAKSLFEGILGVDYSAALNAIEEDLKKVGMSTKEAEQIPSKSDGLNAKEQVLAAVLRKGIEEGCAADSAAGKKFRSMCDAKDKAEYKECKTDLDRKKFRCAFLDRKLKELEVSKSHSTTWKEISEEKGEYICFEQLAISYGFIVNPKKALEKAERYARKACTMGGRWVKYDSMAEDWEILKIKHQYRNLFDESWSMCEKHTQSFSGPQVVFVDRVSKK